jgi:hypothetical protein
VVAAKSRKLPLAAMLKNIKKLGGYELDKIPARQDRQMRLPAALIIAPALRSTVTRAPNRRADSRTV